MRKCTNTPVIASLLGTDISQEKCGYLTTKSPLLALGVKADLPG